MRESALKKRGEFPEYEKMIAAADFQYELNKLLGVQVYHRDKVEALFGVEIILDTELPLGSALLIKDERIVAVIQDKTLTEVKGWKITKL